MKFKTFYNKLNEAPHVLLWGDDHFFDFRREDGDWIQKLIDIFNQHKNKAKEMTKNLLGDLFFKIAFKKDLEKLSTEEKERLKKVLPKEFFK